MKIIDRIRSAFGIRSPQARRFSAAQLNRLTSGWSTLNVSANSDLRMDLEALRARSRDLANNNDYARKFLQMVETNVVGPDGFILRSLAAKPDRTPDQTDRNAVEEAFAGWSAAGQCDTTGSYSFADMQRLLLRAIARDGEALVRRIRDRRLPFGYRQQLLDIDRLDTKYNDELASGNIISMGVELDSVGQPVAYHLLTRHPGDTLRGGTAASVKRERVPAADIFHLFRPDRPEQTRSAPWMHTAMTRLNMLGGYEEAALVAARTGAAKMGFFTSPDGDPLPVSDGQDDTGEFVTDADPGTFGVLPKGYEFQAFNPDYPTANYDVFVKSCLRGIASGLGVAYNTLANDLEGVNFSSIRSGTLEERDNWMVIQKWFVGAYLIPTFNDWLEAALLNGAIVAPNGFALPAGKLYKFKAHTWQGRRWSWVDPLKDIEASLAAIRAGLNSPQQVAAQMGMDLDDIMEALATANARARKMGLPEYSSPTPVQPIAADVNEDPAVVAAKHHADAMVRSAELQRDAAVLMKPAPAPVTPPISLHLQQDEVTRELARNSEATIAAVKELSQKVEDMQIIVNVPEQRELAAPQIHIAAPIVNVAAPEVTANFEAIMPETTRVEIASLPIRKTITEITRNQAGEIINSTQTESDA